MRLQSVCNPARASGSSPIPTLYTTQVLFSSILQRFQRARRQPLLMGVARCGSRCARSSLTSVLGSLGPARVSPPPASSPRGHRIGRSRDCTNAPSADQRQVTIPMPSCLPAGDYLFPHRTHRSTRRSRAPRALSSTSAAGGYPSQAAEALSPATRSPSQVHTMPLISAFSSTSTIQFPPHMSTPAPGACFLLLGGRCNGSFPLQFLFYPVDCNAGSLSTSLMNIDRSGACSC